MKVVIIGSGNVATVLGRKIFAAGNEIVEVVGRNKEAVSSLASILNANNNYNLLNINTSADFYVIAVKDTAIESIAGNLKLDNQLVVHTAASVSKEVLRNCSMNYGVMYPVQSLRKELSHLPEIPLVIDANSFEVINRIKEFSKDWAGSVSIAKDEERLKLHVAAVVVNNFTNHLLAQTEKYCEAENLDFNLLLPLLHETVERIQLQKPSQLQTGPAIRNDNLTIEKHFNILQSNPALLNLYKQLSNSISQFYAGNQ